jgi:hypothetical protein
MNVEIDREPSTEAGTIGRVSVDGAFLCYSLEPPEDRQVYPAIPAGTYGVRMYPSPKFGRMVPLITGVQGRQFIEIHPGNTDKDTEGCVLLGASRNGDMLGNSRVAVEMFQSKIAVPLANHQSVTLTIKDATDASGETN